MAKKYYWLKLKKDFFKRHDIRIIEEMPNGKDYILFYLKMLLESIDHEGALRFSETIPYNEQMLSVITNTNIDIVKSAMAIFVELQMIEVFDDSTIYMNEVQKLIGSETAGAERVRNHREKQKALQCNTDVTKCNTEKDKEKELDTEKEKRDRINYQMIVDMYNEICISFPRVLSLSDARKKAIKARLKKYTVEQFEEVFTLAEESDFLKGANGRDWQASFDWLIKDANFAKVLDGNYENPAKQLTGTQVKDLLQKSASLKSKLEQNVVDNWENKPEPKTAGEDPAIKAKAEALEKQLRGG